MSEIKLVKVFGEDLVALTEEQQAQVKNIAIAKEFLFNGKSSVKVVFFDAETGEPVRFEGGAPYIQAKPGDFLTVDKLRFCQKKTNNGVYWQATLVE